MLWTIIVILLVLWLLGLVSSYTMGGLIHILLVVAVIILIVRLVSGRRVVWRAAVPLNGRAEVRSQAEPNSCRVIRHTSRWSESPALPATATGVR